MDYKVVSAAPHAVSPVTTQSIMRDVVISLSLTAILAVIAYGLTGLCLMAVCVAACVFFEWGYCKIVKKPLTTKDYSAVVTGLILALNLPSTLPLWMAIIGCFIAIIVVKQLFGGLGQNFANPAIVGRIALMVSFATPMTTWMVDGVASATPLATYHAGLAVPANLELLLYSVGGSMGEVSGLALILGGLYLVIRKVISPVIPLVYVATVGLFSLCLGQDPLFHMLAGGVLLGAIFMATDYVTSPITTKGRVIFAIGCGLFTMVIRCYSSYPEGTSFAILLMNLLTPLIDRATMVHLNGIPKKGGANQ
ncbi:MAG: RnfABCDGE type electron transport complex subunit D [Eubacteriales bacterium]